MSKRANSFTAASVDRNNSGPSAAAPATAAEAVWAPSDVLEQQQQQQAGIAMATATASLLDDGEVTTTEAEALLVQDHGQQQGGNSSSVGGVDDRHAKNTKQQNDGSNRSRQLFNVTNQQTQQHWGRFDDPHAEAVRYEDDDVEGGAGGDSGIVATARLDDRGIRMQFIRRVYTILLAQLATTFAVCAMMALNTTIKSFVMGNMALYWFNLIVCFGTLFPLQYYKRNYPTNFYLLAVFTLSMATMVGMITTMYAEAGAGGLVLEAVGITASVFLILTIFTLQSKWDFSFMGAGLGMCLWILLLWGLFGAIFGITTGYVYALGGSILFSGFIIYDTYMICERLDPEDYVVAAIELYLDLVNLFLMILQLLSDRR